MKKKKLKHCRYWEVCKLYNKKHKPCNEGEGFYGSRYPGCYREMSRIGEKNKKKGIKMLKGKVSRLEILWYLLVFVLGFVLGKIIATK